MAILIEDRILELIGHLKKNFTFFDIFLHI